MVSVQVVSRHYLSLGILINGYTIGRIAAIDAVITALSAHVVQARLEPTLRLCLLAVNNTQEFGGIFVCACALPTIDPQRW